MFAPTCSHSGGEEPDFVLVSCAGRAARTGMNELDIERMVSAKRSGEDHLRLSGLGYTIVRPGEAPLDCRVIIGIENGVPASSTQLLHVYVPYTGHQDRHTTQTMILPACSKPNLADFDGVDSLASKKQLKQDSAYRMNINCLVE